MENAEKNKNLEIGEEETEPTMAELRQLISGEMEITLKLNDDVDVTLKELTQKDLLAIDQEIEKRGVTPDPTSNVYNQTVRILKLVKGLKAIRVNNKKTKLISDETEKEKLLLDLGEGVITGLTLQYEMAIAEKFTSVQKKK